MKIRKPSIRNIIRELVQEVLKEEHDCAVHDDKGQSHEDWEDEQDNLEEMNTTANADGYQTPYAFDVDSSEEEHAKNIKAKAEVFDYTSTKNEGNNTVKLAEGRSLYHVFRDHPDMNPQQKIGVTIREINKMLVEVEKLVNISSRYKTETDVTDNSYWKTTTRYLTSLENKLERISGKVREIK
jgi:hypothetical protein